jgi:hypothetical protein
LQDEVGYSAKEDHLGFAMTDIAFQVLPLFNQVRRWIGAHCVVVVEVDFTAAIRTGDAADGASTLLRSHATAYYEIGLAV